MSTETPNLDPYVSKALNDKVSTHQKIIDLQKIVKAAGTGMLTTRASDGFLHARAMTPAGPRSDKQLTLFFVANKFSGKIAEVENDAHVNVSFLDTSSTSWASYSGTARIVTDKSIVKQHWTPMMSAYFGDLGDGVHKGDENDPRVITIEVVPEDIVYWLTTSGAISRTVHIALSALTGHGTAPGELREIKKEEVRAAPIPLCQ
ncbi:hypothetical protein EVG20_g3492 [Dentipellis fragilis]|uniref:General stress protein FMN-binding split barrel domain-containing protein n=1 Tax=Dentipellis fragilis TaxID=205917 RepID=A0A4Y9Z3K6_9AGAM|nr:hypothetical protein EVG20_g3492 [Dentipellis fragilis]